MRPRLTLRLKLALVALALLALPWAGWRYVQEMEGFLLEAQQQALLATARAVATALHDRPQLMHLQPPRNDAAREAVEENLRRAAEQAEKSGQPVLVEEIGRESGAPAGQPEAEIGAILRGLERSTSRIWVVNRELKLLALAGSLKPAEGTGKAADGAGGGTEIWRRLLDFIVPQPTENFDEALDPDVLATGREIAHALLGAPATRLRASADGRVVIASAAYPIWSRDNVVGAVVVEETTNSILAVRRQALERLLLTTLAAFVLAAAVLLGFATRLSSRIRRLRDEAEGAVDARGRLTHLVAGSRASDEIGDLSRSFSAVLEKLAQHHGYLESLAGRLSHELRTPIAVVRSSLENLGLEQDAQQRLVYLARAEEGLARLSKILTRMSEASRLEQGLRNETRVRFDLAVVLRECVGGYRLAYPQREFALSAPAESLEVEGSPDLFAQLLDKLVANADDFGAAGTPIRLALMRDNGQARLEVSNSGPLLPREIESRLFDSMVSARGEQAAGEPHLGLGLYVARLIAEFHGGRIAAANLADGSGVRIALTLPLA
ncbi:MAG TPA: ATP-binding protein [Candidatus Desulfobacillus sp.]|nr:ATP-binding protein [Candidatus Desulfobacillus sp.]